MQSGNANQPGADDSNALLRKITDARTARDHAAKQRQHVRWRLGASLVLLGPGAILLATVHAAAKPAEPWGAILAALETTLLLAALLVPFWPVDSSHQQWIEERLRAELLRREYFLFRTGIGPYLDQKDLAAKVENRLSAINDSEEPIDLVRMSSGGSGASWRDELEGAGPNRPVPTVSLAALVDAYSKGRVEDQKNWFLGRKGEHVKWNRCFEGLAKAALVGAVAASIVHLVRVLDCPDYEASGWLFLSIFALPAVGAALLGFQSLLENERLGHSYAYHAKLLDEFAARLRLLRAEFDHPDAALEDLQLRFARIVLDVESMFSSELLRWHLVVQPRAPRAEV